MKYRSIATVIILSIVTCGIYGLYWLYVTASDLEREGQTNSASPTLQLLLAIFFGFVGYILFAIAADANLNSIKSRSGLMPSDNKVVYIILALFIPVVLVGLVQNEINHLTTNKY